MAASDASGHLTTDELFRRHADFVARFLTRLGVAAPQLEDAIQEVFLVVHRNGGYRPGPAKPTSYLAAIAIRAAAQHRRRAGTAQKRHSEAPVEHMPSEVDDPAHALQVRQELQHLQHALERLPSELSTPLLLVDLEGESCVSVAAAMGCPVGTVYFRLHQARKRLRAALGMQHGRHAAPRSRPAQPAGALLLLGLGDDELSRLLRLAREQPPAGPAVEAMLARHHQLIEAGAELPAWAATCAPQAASWVALVGVAPLAAGAAAMVVVTALFAARFQAQPAATEAPATRAASSQPAGSHAELAVEASPAPSSASAPPRTRRASPAEVQPGAPAQTSPAAHEPVLPATARALPAPKASSAAPAASPSPRAPRNAQQGAASDALAPSAVAVNRPATHDARSEPPAAGPREPQAREQRDDPATAALERPGSSRGQAPERAGSDAELAEMRQVLRAERLLADEPQRALELTRALQRSYPDGYFGEERAYIEVMALRALGHTRELRAKAVAFLHAYPAGLYTRRVQEAAAGQDD